MDRNHTFLFQPQIRQFTDITNFKSYNNNNTFLNIPFKTSFVGDINNQPKTKRSSSKDKNNLKGLHIYQRSDKTSDTLYLAPYQPTRTQRSTSRQYTTQNAPSNYLPNQPLNNELQQQNSKFLQPKSKEPCYNRSLKVSTVLNFQQVQQLSQNVAKQNKNPTTNRKTNQQQSKSKQKFNFRESLGSLSQQIKNTLKLSLKDENSENNTNQIQNKVYYFAQNSNIDINYKDKQNYKETEETYVRYEKSSSFLLNTQIGRLKRPKHLDIKFNKGLSKKQNIKDKQNYNFDAKKVKQQKLYQYKKQKQSQLNPLGRSTVTSAIYSQKNSLKGSSIIQPLTPQLRSARKYDSYNYQKQTSNTYKYDPSSSTSSFKADLSSSYSNLRLDSSFRTPKSSFLQYSSVIEISKYALDRDSFGSKERSSVDRELSLNDFHLGSVKGEGRFGKFYPAIHKKTGLLVGIKQIKKQSLKHMLDQFIQEIKIQSFIQHPNIVKLYGYFASKQNFYLILQYMQEGSLFSFIKKSKKLQEDEASTKLKQICSAVEYLHQNEILHRDIKPENIVMTCDVCKLCDFGWAVYSSTRRRTYCGTLDYVCPQILQGDSYDSCVDIWAIGVLAYEMIVGKAPFYNISRKQTMKKIMECNFELPKQLSQRAKQFISKALNKNPNQRQTIAVLAKHQFLN